MALSNNCGDLKAGLKEVNYLIEQNQKENTLAYNQKQNSCNGYSYSACSYDNSVIAGTQSNLANLNREKQILLNRINELGCRNRISFGGNATCGRIPPKTEYIAGIPTVINLERNPKTVRNYTTLEENYDQQCQNR